MKQIKLTDYVANFLAAQGIRYVFGVTGGAVVHLFDSVARHPGMQPVFTHHEQAAAFAAQAYGRAKEGLGAAFFTTGPGGTNAITGLAGAWLDSVPCLYISGQTRKSHTTAGLPLRQVGAQQIDIVRIVTPLTKSAVMLDSPELIRYELERALYIATSGRPGPVWLDIPLDFQWAMISPPRLKGFVPPRHRRVEASMKRRAREGAERVFQMLKYSKRPLVFAGSGIRLSHGVSEFCDLVKRGNLPFLTTWTAIDYATTASPLCLGRPGMLGQRGANMAPSACDFLLTVGSHLAITLTGTRSDAFAPQARKVMVDIDQDELDHSHVKQDLKVCCDAREFLFQLLALVKKHGYKASKDWLRHCQEFKRLNGIESRPPQGGRFVDPYELVSSLSKALAPTDSVVVDGGGTIDQVFYQAFDAKVGQRVVISAALCAMGSGFPEGVGVALARPRGRTVVLCGDGSFQFNVHELQTIKNLGLKVKIFILSNQGYLSIRHTQGGFLQKRYYGSGFNGGLSLPDCKKVAAAYGIPSIKVAGKGNLKQAIRSVLDSDGPMLCEVMVDPEMQVVPKAGFEQLADGTFASKPLDDMYPYLAADEMKKLIQASSVQ